MDLLRNRLKFNFSYLIYIYLFVYFIVNILFLVDFPFIHSDEAWLSGLSRAMAESGSMSVTEPFFDSFARNPHGIKLIFHLIQIVFLKVFGYKIFTFRLISLLFSIGCLYVFYSLVELIFKSNKVSLLATIILSMDLHYIYSSHLGRQEIIILFFILFNLYYLFSGLDNHSYYRDILIGISTGISIGIHPNSFIVALAIGGVYLFMVVAKKISYKNLLLLILIVSIFALIFIGISLSMDKNFIGNYRESGRQFGVEKGFSEKLLKVRDFYRNIYEGKSVTYYIPNIKFILFLFPIFFIFSILLSFNSDNGQLIRATGVGLIFILLGITLIGRYNVTSIIFIFPFIYILISYSLIAFYKNRKAYLLLLLLVITLLNTVTNIKTYSNNYNDYLNELSNNVEKGAKVLANLNSEYYFEYGRLLDYRNLHHNKGKDLSFKEYIRSREIQYIIYSDEIDYIYEKTPIYNGVYGNVSNYYEEMKTFLEEDCDLIHGFVNSTYGSNIVRLIDEKNWKIYVYRVKLNSNQAKPL